MHHLNLNTGVTYAAHHDDFDDCDMDATDGGEGEPTSTSCATTSRLVTVTQSGHGSDSEIMMSAGEVSSTEMEVEQDTAHDITRTQNCSSTFGNISDEECGSGGQQDMQLQEPTETAQLTTDGTDPEDSDKTSKKVTVGDIDVILNCLKTNTAAPARLMHLINRLVPFAKALPGTPLAFKNAQKQLHSVVASPLYKTAGAKKPWRWFVTFSNADIFEEYIFRMICSDGNGNVRTLEGEILSGEPGEEYLRSLTRTKRARALRKNPALATRSFMIKQELIMKYIVEAEETLGKIHDRWMRVEFQRSLNAHLHIILSVYDEDDIEAKVEAMANAGQRLAEGLASLLKTKVTAQVSHIHKFMVLLSIKRLN